MRKAKVFFHHIDKKKVDDYKRITVRHLFCVFIKIIQTLNTTTDKYDEINSLFAESHHAINHASCEDETAAEPSAHRE